MTLKERLDIKVKRERTKALFHEIAKIFLSLDYSVLQRGVRVHVFSNTGEDLYYVVNSDCQGTKLGSGYSVEDLYKILPILIENGIRAEKAKDGAYLYYQR